MKIIANLLTLVILVNSCGKLTGPSETEGSLLIVSESSVLKVNEAQTLTAIIRSRRGDRAVRPLWTVSDRTVLTVTETGIVTAVSRGRAEVTAAYRDQRTTQEVEVVRDLSGRWVGQEFLKECSQLSGPPPSPCRFVINGYYPLSLTLTQTHGEIKGVITIGNGTLRGRFSGTVRSDGSLVIPDQDLSESETQARISDWQCAVDPALDSMKGSYYVRSGNPSIFGQQVLLFGSEFQAQRQPQ